MFVFDIYRSSCTKIVALQHGEIPYTKDKYESVIGEDPVDILAGITAALEPAALTGEDIGIGELEELLVAYMDFEEAFDVDMTEEIEGLKELLK